MSTSTNEPRVTKAGNSARHGAGLFDIRNIIGALMALYGIVLVIMSFTVSDADKAKANGENLNLWTGLGLLVLAAALIGWALARPIIVDERELAREKAEHEGEEPIAH